MRLVSAPTVVLAFVMVSACGKDDAKKGASEPLPIAPSLAGKLSGSWQSECLVDKFGLLDKLMFAGGNLTETVTTFSGKDCAAGNESSRTDLFGTYRLPGTVNPARNADVVLQSISTVTVTPLTPLFAAGANLVKTCGHDRWVVNQPQSGTPAACKIQNAGSDQFGLYLTVEGNTLTSYDKNGKVTNKYRHQ